MPRPVPLETLVTRLRSLDASSITLDGMGEILSEPRLDEATLRPFLRFRDDHYTRHSLFRNELFDLLLICWKPGQVTPIHNHNGQCGWVRVLRGRIHEVRYRLKTDFADVEIDEQGRGRRVELEEYERSDHGAGPGVTSVDRTRPIHSFGNPRHGARDEPAVTLHVYSRPHDDCLTFDPEESTCERRQLQFDWVWHEEASGAQ